MSSYLNEGGEIRNLQQQITDQQKAVSEAEAALEQKDADIKATETKLKIAEDKIVREKTLSELVDSLSKDKRQVMVELLESVQTANLKKQFEKYLPAVLNEDVKSEDDKTIITEHTGDRNINIDDNNSINADIVNIKRLAGLRS
jgi:formate dehydrogenase maturation protein FdhE